MTDTRQRNELFTGDLARRGTIARIGRLRRENARSGSCAWNKLERPAFATVAMATGLSKSAKHPSLGDVEWGRNVGKRERAVRGDNGGAKSGDLQGARRLVGSLFQRQLPLENVSPNLTVVEKLCRHESYAETNDRRRRRI
jgi:hypothetical protein